MFRGKDYEKLMSEPIPGGFHRAGPHCSNGEQARTSKKQTGYPETFQNSEQSRVPAPTVPSPVF